MLERKVLSKLSSWKSDVSHKCLVVQGPRQVGKTYMIRHFGSISYSEMIEINFKESPQAAEIFDGDLSPVGILMSLKFRFPDKHFPMGDTLIFLDEIQECPNAITALKFLSGDPRFDVIASGSLLGIDYKRPSSYPVGYVNYIHMGGLDFEEFLWAYGINRDLIDQLHQYFNDRKPVPVSVHNSVMEMLRFYAALGGMPEVVDTFFAHKDFGEADRVQRELLRGYQYDIAHYATAEEKVKAEKCYLTLAHQMLDKENHKFQYKEIEHGARAQKFYSSIEWLINADMVSLCRRVRDIRYDLNDYADDGFFRAYTTDLSLLIPMKDYSIKQHIVENTLQADTKGGIYECLIADILTKKGYSLYFYKNESTRKEIDFLIQQNGSVTPIEVKSGHSRSDSINRLMNNKPRDVEVSYKFIDGNTGESADGIITMPLYMAMFI